jgi:GT2 family glycosyltransferase
MLNNTQNPPCAVIILNWNGAKLLRQFLPSVVANTNPLYGNVIVADNGSSDNSLQVLADEFPGVEVMKFSENYGFAGGYNHAIRNVQGKYKYTVLLNSDVETPKGWLEPLIDFLETHENVGAVQPKLLSYNQKDTFEYAGASGGFLDCNGYPYCRGRIFATCEKDNGQYNNPISIFWATGAALTVRTDLYLSAGGLDEDFFAHMEEIDLCWRILLTGADIMVVPQSHVYHLGGGSLPASNPRKTYLNFRNNLLLLHKNLPDATRAKKLFRRRLLDTIAWAKFVATFDFANASAVWRAHRHFASMRKKYTTHPSVDLLDTRTDTHRNILIDYYLRSRRTF